MHTSVLLKEVLEYLRPKSGDNIVDCTLGFGGHTVAFLRAGANVLGIEKDKDIYNCLAGDRALIKVNSSYIYLEQIIKEKNLKNISAIFFDLGVSMWHFKQSGRGFSFQKNELLDMRLAGDGLTAGDIVNKWPLNEIERILSDYGQESFAGRIARTIVAERRLKPIKTAIELSDIIKRALPRRFQRTRIHPATQTFQALRIAVNNELENIEQGISQAFDVLTKNGRLAIISFHSLEDKIVKEFFKEKAKNNLAIILTKKPLRPGQSEIEQNLASRSAKLRIIQKL